MKPIVQLLTIIFFFISVAVLSRCGGSQQNIPPLTITPASLPNGTLGAAYSQIIQTGGGVAPFTWAVIGALPHNLQLAAGAGNTATISGTPDTAAQAIAFSVRVTDSAHQAATQPYMLSIVAEPDTLSFSPAAGLTFSPQLVGTVSATQIATLTNTGSSPVVINSVATRGDFSQCNTCGSGLAAGASCTITATFTPSQPGPIAATITVVDDTVGSPHLLSLSGIGLSSGPNATLSATSLDFGSWGVGTSSFPVSLTLSNYGTTTLSVGSITTSANFGESDNCSGTSLASGTSCTINVTFTPSTTGTLAGTVSVADNTPTSPQTVSLSGTGFAGSCIPQGGECYGPGHPNCCTAPRGHHSYCSNPTGWGTCTES